jgi:hypothetical protein
MIQFNRSMRLKANKMGYSLNQRGLYGHVIRKPGDKRKKLDDGKSFTRFSATRLSLSSFV